MSQENVERVRAVYAEWGRGNFRAGRDLWDRRVQFIPVAELPEGGEYVGPGGVTHFMRDFLQPWTDFTIAAQELIDAGDSVVVAAHHRGVGRTSGLVADLPQQFQVWTFRGHTVIRFEVFQHRADALEAVGLSE